MDELEGWNFVSESAASRRAFRDASGAHAAVDISPSHSLRQGDGGESHPPPTSCGSRLDRLDVATHKLRDRLEMAGYAVFDHAASDKYCEGVRREIMGLHKQR